MSDLPNNVSQHHGHADDAALMLAHIKWSDVKETITPDMQDISCCLGKWKPKLNRAKKTNTAFSSQYNGNQAPTIVLA